MVGTLKPINLCPEKATTVTLACCYLHNFLIRESGNTYCFQNVKAHENLENIETVISVDTHADRLLQLQRTTAQDNSGDAKAIRDKYCSYFCNEGQLT